MCQSGCSIDKHLLQGHELVSAILQQSVRQDETIRVSNGDIPYDIYQHSNVPEVIQCRPLLEELNKQVQELLLEWPDHPTLKQVTEWIILRKSDIAR